MTSASGDRRGQVILLNGASSAGKSSIAHELQQLYLPKPLFRFGVDEFMHFLPQQFFAIEPEAGHPAHQGLRWVLPLETTAVEQVRDALAQEAPDHLSKYDTLQKVLGNLGLDEMVRRRGVQIVCGPAVDETVMGMHRTAAQLARAGSDLVIEHLLLESHWSKDCHQTMAGLAMLWVGLKPPIEVLEKRERDRGFRSSAKQRGMEPARGPEGASVVRFPLL